MRLKFLALFAGLMMPLAAQAQVSFQGFSWDASGKFTVRVVHGGGQVALTGDLRDDGYTATPVQNGDGSVKAELRSFAAESLLAILVTTANDSDGSIFLMERINGSWAPKNNRAIRARKSGILKDFSGVITNMRVIYGFNVRQSFDKLEEYFRLNSKARLQDIDNLIERKDEGLRKLPDPNPERSRRPPAQGVINPAIPDGARRPPGAEGEPQPRGGRNKGAPSQEDEDPEDEPAQPAPPPRPPRRQYQPPRPQQPPPQRYQQPGYNPGYPPGYQPPPRYYPRERGLWDELFGR